MSEPRPKINLPNINHQVLLTSRPTGIPQVENFRLDSAPVPDPAEGEFLVRNIYLSVDPGQRGWALSEVNYIVPMEIGTPMRALAVGQVVKSRTPEVCEGEFLYGWFDWQFYCVARPTLIVRRVDPEAVPLSYNAGLLGINGLTAYIALHELGAPLPGERVLVSTAAGAVGSIVGQIARHQGCDTVGLTGSDEKVQQCLDRFGYSQALNYKSADLMRDLKALAGEGFNVFFDNTGGTILDAGLRAMAFGGRIVQCGTASIPRWSPPPTGLRNEREVLSRRLSWRGFVLFDHISKFDGAAEALTRLYRAGALKVEEDIETGLESAPAAIQALYSGKNKGKKLLFVG